MQSPAQRYGILIECSGSPFISSCPPKFTANPGYSFEVAAHWISSYFQQDNMRLPSSAEEAIAEAEMRSAWMRVRYPNMMAWANESYSGNLDLWT